MDRATRNQMIVGCIVIAVCIVSGVIILNTAGHLAFGFALWLVTFSAQLAIGGFIGLAAVWLVEETSGAVSDSWAAIKKWNKRRKFTVIDGELV